MTDDLIAALTATPPKDKRTRCYYADEWLPSLSPERQVAFEAVMDLSSKWKSTNIYDLAKQAGYEKQYNTLRAHRAGACSCG